MKYYVTNTVLMARHWKGSREKEPCILLGYVALYLVEKYLLKRVVMDREQESGVSRWSERWNPMLWLGFVSLAENQTGKENSILSLFVSLVPNICYKNRQQKGVEETPGPASAAQMHFWSLVLACVCSQIESHTNGECIQMTGALAERIVF